jgi:hypothetical protein
MAGNYMILRHIPSILGIGRWFLGIVKFLSRSLKAPRQKFSIPGMVNGDLGRHRVPGKGKNGPRMGRSSS